MLPTEYSIKQCIILSTEDSILMLSTEDSFNIMLAIEESIKQYIMLSTEDSIRHYNAVY